MGDLNADRNKPDTDRWKWVLRAARIMGVTEAAPTWHGTPYISRRPQGMQAATQDCSWIDHAFGPIDRLTSCEYSFTGVPNDHAHLTIRSDIVTPQQDHIENRFGELRVGSKSTT